MTRCRILFCRNNLRNLSPDPPNTNNRTSGPFCRRSTIPNKIGIFLCNTSPLPGNRIGHHPNQLLYRCIFRCCMTGICRIRFRCDRYPQYIRNYRSNRKPSSGNPAGNPSRSRLCCKPHYRKHWPSQVCTNSRLATSLSYHQITPLVPRRTWFPIPRSTHGRKSLHSRRRIYFLSQGNQPDSLFHFPAGLPGKPHSRTY